MLPELRTVLNSSSGQFYDKLFARGGWGCAEEREIAAVPELFEVFRAVVDETLFTLMLLFVVSSLIWFMRLEGHYSLDMCPGPTFLPGELLMRYYYG